VIAAACGMGHHQPGALVVPRHRPHPLLEHVNLAQQRRMGHRYYVSHALLQNRKANAGSISRVSAPDVEALVCNAVKQFESNPSINLATPIATSIWSHPTTFHDGGGLFMPLASRHWRSGDLA
jgi:hypothetical protein